MGKLPLTSYRGAKRWQQQMLPIRISQLNLPQTKAKNRDSMVIKPLQQGEIKSSCLHSLISTKRTSTTNEQHYQQKHKNKISNTYTKLRPSPIHLIEAIERVSQAKRPPQRKKNHTNKQTIYKFTS